MPRSTRKRFLFWKAKKRRKFPLALVSAGALVLSVLLLAVVLQQTLTRPASFVPSIAPPDFAGLLPAGSETSAGGPVLLPDLPQPAYAVGFKAGDGGAVALFVWDKENDRYARPATLSLATGVMKMDAAPTLTLLALGRGAPDALLARGSMGAYTDGEFVLEREGNTLRFVDRTDMNGQTGAAMFLSGASTQHAEQIDFADVDGDGDKDAVQTSTTTEGGKKKEAVTVYAWKDGRFAYDQGLSWALTKDKEIFPEPAVPTAAQ